jgi:hypothetical protein
MKSLLYTLSILLILFNGCTEDENDYLQMSDLELENGHITIKLNGKSQDGYEFNNETIILSKYINLDHSILERDIMGNAGDMDMYHIQRYGTVIDRNRVAYLGVIHQKIGEYSDEETKRVSFSFHEIRIVANNSILDLDIDASLYANSTIFIDENSNSISGSFEFDKEWYETGNTLNIQVSFEAKVYEKNH